MTGDKKISGDKELRDRLVALIEAERAGVDVAKRMLAVADSGEETALLEEILDGEKDSCKVLGKVLVDLEFEGSDRIGNFADKVMALPEKTERLKLLIKGQEWVVRKLDEVLEGGLPRPSSDALSEVRQVHVVNIGKCRQFVK